MTKRAPKDSESENATTKTIIDDITYYCRRTSLPLDEQFTRTDVHRLYETAEAAEEDGKAVNLAHREHASWYYSIMYPIDQSGLAV